MEIITGTFLLGLAFCVAYHPVRWLRTYIKFLVAPTRGQVYAAKMMKFKHEVIIDQSTAYRLSLSGYATTSMKLFEEHRDFTKWWGTPIDFHPYISDWLEADSLKGEIDFRACATDEIIDKYSRKLEYKLLFTVEEDMMLFKLKWF
jgi:hypothetical protein